MSAVVQSKPTPITAAPTQAEVISVLQNSLYPGAKPESIALVLSYCRVNGLDPMLKPVHIVPTNVKLPNGKYEWRDVLMPGIADYRIKAARSGEYGGKSEPEFGPDVSEMVGDVMVTFPAWCKVTVRRIVQGQAREFTACERWLENYATAGRDSEAPNRMWKKRAYGQLAKCAESQALRMAFPEFSGGYTAEEMEGKTGGDDFAGQTIDHQPAPSSSSPSPSPNVSPESDADKWLKGVQLRLATVQTVDELAKVEAIPSVASAREHASTEIKEQLADWFTDAYARVQGKPSPDDAGDDMDSAAEPPAPPSRGKTVAAGVGTDMNDQIPF